VKVLGALWSGASELLLTILEFFYGITNSFGLAIVLLTIAVRIVLYPLNQKQMTSMQQMQKIQPRLKVLQEKYANDKEKLNQETMRLYKENKVNPAAGCLPLLVQLPILILLFNVLRTYDFAGTSFMGIILGSSTTAGLAQAVGVAADPTGNYGVMSVLTGILKKPCGTIECGTLYR
jgi:membrane protein insertase, YidC/Oxa1 family, C-terminal domain